MHNRFLRDLLSVIIGNGVSLLSSVFIILIIPKFMKVSEFGYFKIFTLYASYAGLLHFGFVDGILLKYSGYSYDDLDKTKFRLDSKFFVIFQLLISIIIIILSMILLSPKYKILSLLISIDSVLVNITTYLQFISQATMMFKQLTIRNIIQSILRILAILFLVWIYIAKIINQIFASYLIFLWVLIDFLLMSWYILSYKDIFVGDTLSIKGNWQGLMNIFKIGLPLTTSYQISTLTYNLDNQFVSTLYSTKIYGTYAFAYSLMALVNVVINAISIVLLPNLKKMSRNEMIVHFNTYVLLISILVFGGIISYYPLCFIVKFFLPEYIHSLIYLKIIFPGLGLSSCINAVFFTYYQVLNKTTLYFKIGMLILVISFATNFMVSRMFNTAQSISIASIGILVIWYILSEWYFIKKYHVHCFKNLVYALVLMTFFYISASFNNYLLGILIYGNAFIIMTTIFYYSQLIQLRNDILHNSTY